jgi:hypothetical protein
MLTQVTVKSFKRLHDATIPLDNPVVLAGPNNSGKTTAIQALSTWHFALRRWLDKRSEKQGKTGKKKTGVPISRRDFTPVPLREANLLWENRKVLSSIPRVNTPILLQLIVKGREQDREWECGIELQYANPELFYCRPTKGSDIPKEAEKVQIVHVPPLAGMKTEEGRRDIGEQNLIIGEGRPGEILRNLLLEIYENKDKSLWPQLEGDVAEIFQVKILSPQYSRGQAYISVEYIPGLPPEGRKNGLPTLDIASGGSGFHQVLLLLAFFYARPGSILLLDEPDAHLHVILQRDVYDHLVKIAEARNSQLIIATHSEVILDRTEPTNIVAFTGPNPHTLVSTAQRAQLRKGLTEVRSVDFLLASQKGGVLYAEGSTDLSILKAWAQVLHHRATEFLSSAFFKAIEGNEIGKARNHFYALYEAFPDFRGVCILDKTDTQLQQTQLVETMWRRREIENYLIVPSAIDRFLSGTNNDLFSERIAAVAREWMNAQLPPEAYKDPFSDQATLMDIKASESFFEQMFDHIRARTNIYLNYSKSNLYILASSFKPAEIHPEIKEKLDLIAQTLCRTG